MATDGRPYLHFRPDEELLSTVQKIASDNGISLAHATRLLCISGIDQYALGNIEIKPVTDKRSSKECGEKIWTPERRMRMKKKSGKHQKLVTQNGKPPRKAPRLKDVIPSG